MQVARNSKQIALIRFEPLGGRFERLRQRFQTLSERFVFQDLRFTSYRKDRAPYVRSHEHSRAIAGNLSRRTRNLSQIALIRFKPRKFRFKTQ